PQSSCGYAQPKPGVRQGHSIPGTRISAMTLGAGTDAARPGVRQNSQYGHKTNPPTGKRARIMAQKTVVTLYDDLDGSTEHVEPVSFALDGQTYDIDLSRVNAGTLREVRPFVTGRARRAGRFPSADASRLRSSVSMTLRTEPDPDIRITRPEPARWECLPGPLNACSAALCWP